MTSNNQFISETTFRVRYVETDAMGIVSHVNYIVYFEEGRSNYARQRGHSYSQFENDGYYLMVTEVTARYIKPARYDREITVKTWIAETRSRTITFNYEILDTLSNELLVTGMSKHICVTKDGVIARIPDNWRTWGAS